MVVLPAWAGFQNRRGSYDSVSDDSPSTGMVRLCLLPPGDRKHRLPPTAEQVAAYRFLTEHGKLVHDSVFQALFDEYPSMRAAWLDDYDIQDEDSEEAQEVPAIQRPEQLRELMGLACVHVLAQARQGIAFIGFEFGCVWEREHGLGVMTHTDRVLAIGDAETSFRAQAAWLEED